MRGSLGRPYADSVEYTRLAGNPIREIRALVDGDRAGLIAATSGSTGSAKDVAISRDALMASIAATGMQGHWLLALPPDRIGGALVVARAHVSGHGHTAMAEGSFTARAFADAVAGLPDDGPLFTSLVPTQLRRVLASPEATEALARFDAVLVGGAALPEDAPATVVRTYGMTETCGGCVYDGCPLDGVEIAIEDGRVRLTGPMLAEGYLDASGGRADDPAFVTEDGRRWFVTSDMGRVVDGRLEILGRVDDVVNTGGFKVHPLAVERALGALATVAEVLIAPAPDDEWGQRLVALVVPVDPASPPSLDELRDAPGLARHERPSALRVVEDLPRTEAGKIDRRAAARIAAAQ